MPTVLDIHHENPCRPPNWRWLRAIGIADEGRQRPTRRRDGPDNMLLIRHAVAFRRAYMQAITDPVDLGSVLLADRYPALTWAHQIYAESAYAQTKSMLEARILARQTNREIAFHIGSTIGIVEEYEKLFFSVRDRLDNADYILHRVIGNGLHAELLSSNFNVLWKLFGYLGGPHVLDSLARRIANPTWASRPDEVLAFFHDVAVGTMKQRAAIAATTVPIESSTRMRILESFVKYVEVESTAEGTGQAESQLMGNLAAILSSLGDSFAAGTKPGKLAQQGAVLDTTAIELRGSELIALAAGNEIEDQEELLALQFPVAAH